MNEIPENELRRLFASPDEGIARAALEELIPLCEGQLRAAAKRFSNGNRHEADELFCDACAKVWEKRESYTPSHVPWWGWAVAVMGGCARARRRHQRGQLESSIEFNSDRADRGTSREDSADVATAKNELQRSMKECLANLTEEQQAVVVLHLYLGIPFRRITELLRLGEGPTPASYRYVRSIQQLKRCLLIKGHSEDDLGSCGSCVH